MYLCLCKGITDEEFWTIIARHQGSVENMRWELGLDESCCGRCEAHLLELIKDPRACGC